MELNPQRAEAICQATGWSRIEPGSLNLEVQPSVVSNLENYTPVWVEDGKSVIYPPTFQHIPKLRKGYWYYRAIAIRGDIKQEVLVRRAVNPLPNRLELFAPNKLTKIFDLSRGDALSVEINEDLP